MNFTQKKDLINVGNLRKLSKLENLNNFFFTISK